MARGELQAALGNEVQIGRGRYRSGDMDRSDDLFVLMRSGDCENVGKLRADDLRVLAHAAGDDHAPVLGDRLADRGEALLLGGIEEAAGVDQHHVRFVIVRGEPVAVGAQLGEDSLGIDQRLGAAERDHADLGRGGKFERHERRLT
jgi:hypothetical protein